MKNFLFLLQQQQQRTEITKDQAQKFQREKRKNKNGQCLLLHSLPCLCHHFLHHCLECLLNKAKHLWSIITVMANGHDLLKCLSFFMNISLLPSFGWSLRKSLCFSTLFSSFFFLASTSSQCKSAAWVLLSYLVVVQLMYQLWCPFPWWSILSSTCYLKASNIGIYSRGFLVSADLCGSWWCFWSWWGWKNPLWSHDLCLKCLCLMWCLWMAQSTPPRARVNKKSPKRNFLHLFLWWCCFSTTISMVLSLVLIILYCSSGTGVKLVPSETSL